jgi:hypothetical protein
MKTLIDRWIGSRKSLISLWSADNGYHVTLMSIAPQNRHHAPDCFFPQAIDAMARIDYLMHEISEEWTRV